MHNAIMNKESFPVMRRDVFCARFDVPCAEVAPIARFDPVAMSMSVDCATLHDARTAATP